MRFATIPTRTERPTLWPLLDVLTECQVTPIIVRTKPDAADVPGAVLLDGCDRMSITYWWNLGIDYATTYAAPLLVLNDDLGMTIQMVEAMFTALEDHDLVWSKTGNSYMHTPFSGSCFGVRPGAIRLDESFTWWHGDDDLYRRAKAEGLRLTQLDIEPDHVRTTDYERWDETMFADAIPKDQALYFDRWSGVEYA
jgi:hypothetical protein